jgi:hypothetical protein
MHRRTLTLLTCLFVVAPTAVLAGGPPFLSLESPADPLDARANDAVAFVHAHLCGRPTDGVPTATAEGVVDGRRVSRPVTLAKTTEPGTWAVKTDWPRDGSWVLVLSLVQHVPTATLVELAPKGGIVTEEHYGRSVPVLQVRSLRVLDHAPNERDLAPYFRSAVGQ